MTLPKATTDLLSSFLSGETSLAVFERRLADRLFVLRQTPRLSKEKRLLAAIQLRLHEAGEGGDKSEVHMAVREAIDALQAARPEPPTHESRKRAFSAVSDKPNSPSDAYRPAPRS